MVGQYDGRLELGHRTDKRLSRVDSSDRALRPRARQLGRYALRIGGIVFEVDDVERRDGHSRAQSKTF